jgi:predicted RNA-binding Zn ribbon-like protein
MEYKTIPRNEVIARALAESISGWLCLSFANTVEDYRLSDPLDAMTDYNALLEWSKDAGTISPEDEENLSRQARLEPARAEQLYETARSLRSIIYRVFSAIPQDTPINQADLDGLNALLERGMSRLRIENGQDGGNWTWKYAESGLEMPLWPIAQSAAELLMSPDLKRLRQCKGQKCTWLFLDRSKNRSRRWCDMEVCGNRAKSQRHYARSKSGV